MLAAARFPKKVNWPSWWEADLRSRGEGWRAKPRVEQENTSKQPEEIRINLRDQLRLERERELRRSAIEQGPINFDDLRVSSSDKI